MRKRSPAEFATILICFAMSVAAVVSGVWLGASILLAMGIF